MRTSRLRIAYDRKAYLGVVSCRTTLSSNFTIVVWKIMTIHESSGQLLGHLGVNVVLAGTRSEASRQSILGPELGVVDIKMPGRTGFDVLSEIRALGPFAGGSVPLSLVRFSTHAKRAYANASRHACRSRSLQNNLLQKILMY